MARNYEKEASDVAAALRTQARHRRRAKAQGIALRRLAKEFPDKYSAYYAEALKKIDEEDK